MTFTTPCFVRVEDPAEREKLIEWLDEIGYEYVKPPKEEYSGYKVICESSYCGTAHDEQTFATAEYIDAGTNVDLFRALAAMNDKNDREQWFVAKKNISDCYDIDDIIYQKGDMFFNASGELLVEKNFRKATAEEIVKYFKKK